MKKKVLITGIMGQDGAYLADLLLKKNYIVYGIIKNYPNKKNDRLIKLNIRNKIHLIKTNIENFKSIKKIIKLIKPNEIYNLAAVSNVSSSFVNPINTVNTNCIGLLNILESVREISKKIKIYQASSSEMYGNSKEYKINEESNLAPTSPYGISKVASHYLIKFYRDAYKLKCSSGILFNHESPLRGENFVTKKIVKQLYEIKNNQRTVMYLGNIYSKKDWGYAPEYVEVMWKILQLNKFDNFVICTGKSYTIKNFIKLVCKNLNISTKWVGIGINERCIDIKKNKTIIKINKKLYRPLDVKPIIGNSNKAFKSLNWKPKIMLDELVKIMCENEKNK